MSFQLCYFTWAKILLTFFVLSPATAPSPTQLTPLNEHVWFEVLWSMLHLFSVFPFPMDGLLWFQAEFLIFLLYLLKKSHYLATISLNPSHLQTWYHLTLWPLCKSCLFLLNSHVCSLPCILISLWLTISGLQLA